MNLTELKIGQEAIVLGFTDKEMSLKFMEMGCIPGEVVKLLKIAPFGDPISILVSGYELGMRKKEASTILVQ